MCKTEVESAFSQGAGEEPAAYVQGFLQTKRKCEENRRNPCPLDAEMQT